MNSIQIKLLSALLDKYERSGSFREQSRPTRRIRLRLYDGGKSDFSYYDIENSERRDLVNRAVIELSETDVVFYQWMKGETGHILAGVWLNADSLPLAYALARRKPKDETLREVCGELTETLKRVSSPWAKNYLQDALDAISQKRKIAGVVPEDPADRRCLLTAMQAVDSLNGHEIVERVFSLQYLGDSKRFEKTVRSRLIGILKKYLDADDDARDDALLGQVGIVKYPEQFEFCGKVSLVFGGGVTDYAPLRFGGSVFASDLTEGKLVVSPKVTRILSIENRANYMEYIAKSRSGDELVLYHGGQYSPAKKNFFLAVRDAMPEHCDWFHWGDIDYGGFAMLARLRRELKQDVLPFRMSREELLRYKPLTAAIAEGYIEKLSRLTQKPELSDCRECLDFMIANRIRLEQEAMLLE